MFCWPDTTPLSRITITSISFKMADVVKNGAQSGERPFFLVCCLTGKDEANTVGTAINCAFGDAKTRQMESFTQHQDKDTPLTTYFGTKMAETDLALRAGARGPTVLEGQSCDIVGLCYQWLMRDRLPQSREDLSL